LNKLYFGKAAVLGAGVSGRSAIRLLEDYGNHIEVFDDRTFKTPAEVNGYPVRGAVKGRTFYRFDIAVPSPGIPRKVLEKIRAPLISEVELGYRKLVREESFIFSITGTNGKTTVTTLLNHLLREENPVMAGNVGIPLSSVKVDRGVFVLELSSFQLSINRGMRFDTAILLNVAPDHLDWHGDFQHYLQSKLRMFAYMNEKDVAILNMDDEIVVDSTRDIRTRKLYFSLDNPSADAYWVSDTLFVMGEEVFHLGVLSHASRRMFSMVHNRYNLSATALAIYDYFYRSGREPAEETTRVLSAYLPSYQFPPHRLQFVAEIGGIEFYNDSKATNPHAVLHALRTFEKCVLIMAGLTKGLDLTVLKDEIEKRVTHLIGIGVICEDLKRAGFEPVCVNSLEEAVEKALELSEGEPVLFSPGGSSFDMFRNYAHRGEEFVKVVERIANR